jgi:hypothetical protein
MFLAAVTLFDLFAAGATIGGDPATARRRAPGRCNRIVRWCKAFLLQVPAISGERIMAHLAVRCRYEAIIRTDQLDTLDRFARCRDRALFLLFEHRRPVDQMELSGGAAEDQ